MHNEYDLILTTGRPALMAGQPNTVDLLVRIQAPDSPKTGLPERPHLNLSLVIDRSGSMAGLPLSEAKRAAVFIIDSLKATDRASIIAYDNVAKVYAKNQLVEDKEYFKSAISRIKDRGATNLHAGWLKGADEAASQLAPDFLSRILLLSDGRANEGLTDLDQIAHQCAQLADSGVTTSTYGLGSRFNEELMVAMSRSGRGNGYYSEDAKSLHERFYEEFSLLSALCARNLRLSLTLLPGVSCKMLNLYEEAANNTWILPDLAYDGEAWAAIRLHVPVVCLPAVGEHLAFVQATVVHDDNAGVHSTMMGEWLSLPVLTEEQFNAVPKESNAIRRIAEAEAARLQDLASRAARKGNWEEVEEHLSKARKMAPDNPWFNEIIVRLEALAALKEEVLFSKQAFYSSSQMSSKLRSKMEFREDYDDTAMPMHLQRIVQQRKSDS